jgi:hypothetical protein
MDAMPEEDSVKKLARATWLGSGFIPRNERLILNVNDSVPVLL